MSNRPVVEDATFARQVEQTASLVAVDFSAEWCAPCRIMAPVLDSLASEYGPRLRILGHDADRVASASDEWNAECTEVLRSDRATGLPLRFLGLDLVQVRDDVRDHRPLRIAHPSCDIGTGG